LFLDLKRLYRFIIFIEKYYNKYISIIFIGGEPTLHPDLLWFCESVSNREKINLLIYTNFELELKFFLNFKKFKNIFFKISFHYINLDKTNLFLEKL
jgi:organic radical activating enzyme